MPSTTSHPSMNLLLRVSLAVLAVAGLSFAAASKPQPRLTPARIVELSTAASRPVPNQYEVKISDLGAAVIRTNGNKVALEKIHEFRFPTEFTPPQASLKDQSIIVPTTPSAFETINSGWTVTLTAKAHGPLVELCGTAEYTEVEMINGGYGPLSGPIHTEEGKLITPNRLDQPLAQTTTTRFHLFAVPGESYEITLYRGKTKETRTISVSEFRRIPAK
jgi:hypothetical protein